jgi:3-methyladenine DNA glycosylase Tag
MVAFKTIRARAAKRKGGEKALESLLPNVTSQKVLAKLGDDRMLAEMAKRIFSAGFVWSVIEQKWPGFEAAFLGFDPKRLLFQPDEFWEGLASDKRIVRNPQKIKAVRENAKFVTEIACEHGSFGKFLSDWPAGDQIGLLELMGKRGARLGGRTGQYFLRFIGIRVAAHAHLAHLRDVDWRELRYRDADAAWRRRGGVGAAARYPLARVASAMCATTTIAAERAVLMTSDRWLLDAAPTPTVIASRLARIRGAATFLPISPILAAASTRPVAPATSSRSGKPSLRAGCIAFVSSEPE